MMGFFNVFYFADIPPASAKTYPFMDQVLKGGGEMPADALPTGLIKVEGLKQYQEFVFDDAKRDFGAYAFRFANPSVPEGQAVKAINPMMQA